MPENDAIAEFRRAVAQSVRMSDAKWEDSRHLLAPDTFSVTLRQLDRVVTEAAVPPAVRTMIGAIIGKGKPARPQDLDGGALKTLTGLPPSKALRALFLYFGLVRSRAARWPIPDITTAQAVQAIQASSNPFDALLAMPVASVLDLGAGDLSFVTELVEQYVPRLETEGRELIVHAIDRLDPASKLGGPLHAGRDRIAALRRRAGLTFGFYGGQDMFRLEQLDEAGLLAPQYSLVTCWAPATPTFAYEPTRLSSAVIDEHLRRNKGAYRSVRYEGEAALEVQHGERALIFPPWKFDIRGPVALLELLARRSRIGILGAVDSQVFWELLAQLLEDPRYRPTDVPFDEQSLPLVFGDIYRRLTDLPLGETVPLDELGPLRSRIPGAADSTNGAPTVAFRYVSIRRGAMFPGVPVSSTARQFSQMREEAPPWFLTLVPEQLVV